MPLDTTSLNRMSQLVSCRRLCSSSDGCCSSLGLSSCSRYSFLDSCYRTHAYTSQRQPIGVHYHIKCSRHSLWGYAMLMNRPRADCGACCHACCVMKCTHAVHHDLFFLATSLLGMTVQPACAAGVSHGQHRLYKPSCTAAAHSKHSKGYSTHPGPPRPQIHLPAVAGSSKEPGTRHRGVDEGIQAAKSATTRRHATSCEGASV